MASLPEQRYPSLSAYVAAQARHPGFPADQCYVGRPPHQARLEVMENGDVLLESLADGAVEVWGRVHGERRFPNVLDALLDPIFARRQLDGHNSTVIERDELEAAMRALPAEAGAQAALVAAYQARQAEAEAVLRDGQRRSFAVVSAAALPDVPTDALFRRDQVDYAAADWRRCAEAARGYLLQGGDPLDTRSAYEHALGQGLDEEGAEWTASLFSDPIKLGEGADRFGNGRHRAMAALAQGVAALPVFTAQAMPAAERRAAQIRAGAPALRPLHQAVARPEPEAAPALDSLDL